jgi:hypothetical protein
MRIDLRHTMSPLLDVYYKYVHPMFPFLPARDVVDDLASIASINAHADPSTAGTDGNVALLLAICGYTDQLSPSSPNTTLAPSSSTHANANPNLNPSTSLGGIANKIPADLWYERAFTLATNRLRRGSSLKGVQTLLLCAPRDQGRGVES